MAEVRRYYVRYWYLTGDEVRNAAQEEEAFSAEDAAFQVGLCLSRSYDGWKITAVDPIRAT